MASQGRLTSRRRPTNETVRISRANTVDGANRRGPLHKRRADPPGLPHRPGAPGEFAGEFVRNDTDCKRCLSSERGPKEQALPLVGIAGLTFPQYRNRTHRSGQSLRGPDPGVLVRPMNGTAPPPHDHHRDPLPLSLTYHWLSEGVPRERPGVAGGLKQQPARPGSPSRELDLARGEAL